VRDTKNKETGKNYRQNCRKERERAKESERTKEKRE